MKLFGSKSYVDAPPAPKMPPGLVELMEGLTKEVLKNNPTEVYEFCAEHMRKLLELRDNNTPKRCLTLEQKILKANSVIRQRAEQRRQKYDFDMQKLQQNKQVIDTYEIKSFDTECLPIKSKKNPSNANLKSDDEHFNNNSVTTSANIEHKETNQKFNDGIITSKVHVNNYSDENEQQVKSDDQINKSIENSPIQSVQNVVDEITSEETKGIIAAVTDDHTKEGWFLKEITEDESRDAKEENTREKVNQQGDVGNQPEDQNDYVNDNEFANNSNNDKCQREANNNFTHTIVTNNIVADADQNSQIGENQEIISSDKIQQKEVKEKTTQIKEQTVTHDEGDDQNELKVEAAVNIENYQNEKDEQSVSNEGNQTEIKGKDIFHGENNKKGTKEQPITDKKADQNETKEEEAATDEKNNQNEIELSIPIEEDVVINNKNHQKGIEEQPVTDKKGDENEIKEVAINEENNQKEIKERSVTKKGEGKEYEERIVNNEKSEPAEPVVTQEENNHIDVEEQSVTKDKKHQIEEEGHTNSDYQNDQKEIKVQVDMKSITEEQTRIVIEIQDEDVSNKNLEKEIIKTTDDNETTMTTNETIGGIYLSNQDKKVFETTGDISKDRPKDELEVTKDDFNKGDPEESNGVTQSLISSHKQSELVLEHDDPNTYNKEHIQINVEPSHLDQLQTQDPDKKLVNVSSIGTENVVDEIIDKPLIINIDLQQNDKGGSIDNNNKNQGQNIDENYTVKSKESGTVELKNSKPMDLETAAITIQKVFRNFLFRSKTSSFDDSTNVEFNIFDHDSDMKDTVYSNQNQILSKDKRSIGISRMDTVLQTVNEEKSLSLSTDDSSTLSSAATVIQAHIRGFLVRNRLNRNKTISSTSLADSDDPPASFETDPDPARNKTVLNIHIVPEGSHFLSRDESMLTSVELSLDGSPPASSNLHPLGYDKNERRKQLKREDAVQSISPPINNSTRLSEEHDSVKEVLLNDAKNETRKTVNEDLPVESTISDDSDSDDVLSKGTVEEKQIDNQNLATTSDKKAEVATAAAVSSDELDVVTPFENVEGKNNGDSDSNKLVHSGEFHDVVLPTKVSRNDTSVVRGE